MLQEHGRWWLTLVKEHFQEEGAWSRTWTTGGFRNADLTWTVITGLGHITNKRKSHGEGYAGQAMWGSAVTEMSLKVMVWSYTWGRRRVEIDIEKALGPLLGNLTSIP